MSLPRRLPQAIALVCLVAMSGCNKDDSPPEYTKESICDISSDAAAAVLGTREFENSEDRRSTMPFDGDAPLDNLDGHESRSSCTISTGDTSLVLQGKLIGPGEADVAHNSAEKMGHVFRHAGGLGGVNKGSSIWACGQVQLIARTQGGSNPDEDALQKVLEEFADVAGCWPA